MGHPSQPINRGHLVTATEAAWLLHDVTRTGIAKWVERGKLHAKGRRGRSPLYAWGDILDVEREARQTPKSPRHRDRKHAYRPETLAA